MDTKDRKTLSSKAVVKHIPYILEKIKEDRYSKKFEGYSLIISAHSVIDEGLVEEPPRRYNYEVKLEQFEPLPAHTDMSIYVNDRKIAYSGYKGIRGRDAKKQWVKLYNEMKRIYPIARKEESKREYSSVAQEFGV